MFLNCQEYVVILRDIGMWISYQIITEKQFSSLHCNSALGQEAEFLIEIPIRQSKLGSLSAKC